MSIFGDFMTQIKVINYRGKKYYKANSIISLLGYNGKINTANFVMQNVPEEHRTQFTERKVWYVDATGMAIMMLKGKAELSESCRKFCQELMGDMLAKTFNELDKDGEIEIAPNFTLFPQV